MRWLLMLHMNTGCRFLLWGLIIMFLLFASQSRAFSSAMKRQIVFSTQEELRIINLDDKSSWKNPVTLPMPYDLDMASHPSWMHGGDSIIFEYSSTGGPSWGLIKEYLAEVDTNGNRIHSWEKHLPSRKGGLSYPKWSPNGRYLAVLDFERLIMGKEDEDGYIRDQKNYYALIIFDINTRETKRFDKITSGGRAFSWSWDNKKIAYETSNREIAVYDLDQNVAIILDKGDRPVFHPISGEIYYVGLDTYLYRIDIDTKQRHQVDDGNWNWIQTIGFSRDGDNFFYVGGGNWMLMEYMSINVFNLRSHKKKRISKRYVVIHGASLFEPE